MHGFRSRSFYPAETRIAPSLGTSWNDTPKARERVGDLAADLDLPIVGDSDAHCPFEVLRTSSRVEADELTPGSVVEAIRDGLIATTSASAPSAG